MNSYNLGISGSWLLLILLLLISATFTLFTYYRTNPPINRGKKTFLIGLRTLALSLLIFSLFEPVLTGIRSKIIAPKIAVLYDNSLSMKLEDAGGERINKYKSAVNNSKLNDYDKDNIIYRKFGETSKIVKNFSFDSLNFNDNLTDLSTALNSLFSSKQDENVKAIVLFTDGAFNTGTNPLYSAEELSLPIFTVGIGDSTEPKDISVQSLILNEVAYIDNPVPINVNIKANGYNGEELSVSIFDNNKLLENKKLKLESDFYEGTIYFTYLPKEAGNRKITVKIDDKKGEITLRNNSISEFIKVLKNKRIISIFGGAPNADLSFVKQHLNTMKGVEVKEFVQSSGSSFYKMPTENEINSTELFILIGFPVVSTPEGILDKISKELSLGKPVLLITSLNTDFTKLRKLEEYLPFNTASSRPMEFSITSDFNVKAVSSPLIRINGTDDDIEKWKNLPPVFRTETFVRPKPESEIIATFKVNNVPLNEPFIISRNMNTRKSVAVIGYGLFRWKLLGYGSELSKGNTEPFDGFTTFLDNSLRWLSVSDLSKRVTIATTKKNYSKGEKIEFTAQVYDGSYLPVDNAMVNVSVSGNNESRNLNLVSTGNGRYYSSLDGLPSGDYAFSGDVVRNSQKIGSDDGRFSIGNVDSEHRNLRMQSGLLRAMSESSGGKFYNYDDVSNIINDIKSLQNFKPKPLTLRNDFALWNYAWVLIIALLLFALEWVIRKRAGMI
jgi:hypothetical protein